MKNNPLHNPFKVPKDYFDSLEDHLLLRVKINKNRSQSNFEVPSAYFDTIDQRIQLRLHAEKSENRLLRTLVQTFTAAAALLLFFLTTPFATQNKTTDNELLSSYADELLMYNTIDYLDAYDNMTFGFEESETLNTLNNYDPDYYPELSYPWNYAELDQ